jgi:hypothetical protein
LEGLLTDGRILKGVLKKWNGEHRLDLSGSEYRPIAAHCEKGNEPPISVKCGKAVT